MRTQTYLCGLLAMALGGVAACVQAQTVAVTLRLDTNAVISGQTTQLRVYAQVLPAYRFSVERIFSWYVDVLNTNGAVATANYAAMQRTASDNDPRTSSTGVADGAHRRGIHDTFLNLAGAGVDSPVELMTIPITGQMAGRSRFRVLPGSGLGLTDFIVHPVDPEATPLTGGDFSAANVDLQVLPTANCMTELAVVPMAAGQLRLTFPPCPGFNHTVEFRNELNDATGWQPMPGGPHNSGDVLITITGTQRFYRVRTSPQ